jgi:hypothetical protein
MKLEMFLIEFPYILALQHLLQVLLKMHQLTILSSVVWQNGNAVLKLEHV